MDNMINAWLGRGGALVVDQQVPGCGCTKLSPYQQEWYSGPYILGESMSYATARTIAEALDLEWHDLPPAAGEA